MKLNIDAMVACFVAFPSGGSANDVTNYSSLRPQASGWI